MEKSELRRNKATGQWVIFAPSRRKRPRDFKQPAPDREQRAVYEADCPFCPGNEHLLMPILEETPGLEGHTWQTRVVPNKFAALMPHGDTKRRHDGVFLALDGVGRHEVVIEHPDHNKHPALMSVDELEVLINTYHMRYRKLMGMDNILMAMIFRNHGRRAGTSLEHPHSQIIAAAITPRHIREREREAQRYLDINGRCVFCKMLEYELRDRRRVVYENEAFVAFVPYAAEVPFELWIVPRDHQADFGRIPDLDKRLLAKALGAVLRKLYDKLDNPDYNYVINTSLKHSDEAPESHWYVQIRPRTTTPAGFEIGTGMHINPSLPEADADFLNED